MKDHQSHQSAQTPGSSDSTNYQSEEVHEVRDNVHLPFSFQNVYSEQLRDR